MDFALTDEHRRIQETVRDFGEREVKPHAAAWDRDEAFPHGVVAQLTAVGVATIFTPGATTQEIVAWVREHVRPRTA